MVSDTNLFWFHIMNAQVCNLSCPLQGKSLISKKNFNEEDILFEERPLVSSQFLWNEFYKYDACEYCLRSLETAENQSRRLTEDPTLTLPFPECDETDQSKYVNCPQCQVLYTGVLLHANSCP